MLKRQNTSFSFCLNFKKIVCSPFSPVLLRLPVSCLSLCLPESLLTALQATQAGLCGVLNHPSPSCFPVPLSHFPRTYVTCLQPTFSNDISPELFEWLNHNNSLRCIALSPFHKWENEVQVQTACQEEAVLNFVFPTEKKFWEHGCHIFTPLVYVTEDSVVLGVQVFSAWLLTWIWVGE